MSDNVSSGWARGPFKPLGIVLLWLLAASIAVTVGLVAVTTVGASLRDRGPLGDGTARQQVTQLDLREGSASPDTSLPLVEKTFNEDFGEFVVACQGPYAVALDVRPDTGAGWRTVSYERGPDDDVDAVFANRRRSIEIEVFCNRGEPTISEIERDTLPEES